MVLEASARRGVFVVVGDYFGVAIGRLPEDPVRTTTCTSFPALLGEVDSTTHHALMQGYHCDVGLVEAHMGCVQPTDWMGAHRGCSPHILSGCSVSTSFQAVV
jgi:hypothetical protein